jgi:cobalt-zinc-cadmium efflux system membrane fusion protein
MKVRHGQYRWQLWIALAAVSAVIFVFPGCQGPEPASNAKNSGNPDVFTIPQEQMSHVQVLKVQPAPLTRMLRLTGAVAYNGFRTTPVITQLNVPVARVVVNP